MKVLHVTPSIADIRGGTSQAILGMVSALRYQGVAVDIVTTNDNGPTLLEVPLGSPTIYRGASIYFFPRFSPVQAGLRDFAFSYALGRWLNQFICTYDLVHIHALFSFPCTFAMGLARRYSIPYVNHPHGLLCDWSLQQSRAKKMAYLTLTELTNLRQSKAILVTSQKEKQELQALSLEGLSKVVPLGLSMPPSIPEARQCLRQHLGLPLDQPIVLFLSRIHPKKGLEYLIQALGQISHQRFTFVLAGNGDAVYEAKIKTLINEQGLHNQTCLLGFVEGETKELILQGSDLFALTSYSENFGVSVLEAMAAGLPVLVTPGVALAAEVEEHKVGYTPALEVSEIAQALSDCLKHPEEAKIMGDRARQLVLNYYTWERVAAQLVDVYADILKDKTAQYPHATS
jgi:glycosyltransferase involved in cell wall biosynthesis